MIRHAVLVLLVIPVVGYLEVLEMSFSAYLKSGFLRMINVWMKEGSTERLYNCKFLTLAPISEIQKMAQSFFFSLLGLFMNVQL